MWLDIRGERRIENIRASEAAATGAAVVATACPFCNSMLRAGRQSDGIQGRPQQVMDLAELVVQTQGW
jgi:dimethylglycine catabolism B